ncbi:MAG: DNA topoisomerase IB [Actinomycetota bacterium]|nr:DNA topoisomerase IB [Actinomycetota bacterium]
MAPTGSAETTEAAALARRAGLKYLPDDRPGITRQRRGKGFSYIRSNGRPISERERARVRDLVVPPAWRDVWIAPEPDAHLLVTGFDEMGRKQYLYHPAWRQAADAAKFVRLGSFGKALTKLRRRVAGDIASESPERVCAAAVLLVDETLIRPGSRRQYRTMASVGATTLRAKHVEVKRDLVVLDFVGKGGAEHHLEVRDQLLARALSDLLDEANGSTLFTTEDGDTIDESMLNDYIERNAGPGFTAKDLRTWGATSTVVGELGPVRTEADATAKQLEAVVKEAVEIAAEALGNTPTVCRASYVAPVAIDSFMSGALAGHWQASRAGKWMSRAERATERVLAAKSPAVAEPTGSARR